MEHCTGSEGQDKTLAEGLTYEEGKPIDNSLSALGNVVTALADNPLGHIPYRDSKLTQALQVPSSEPYLFCDAAMVAWDSPVSDHGSISTKGRYSNAVPCGMGASLSSRALVAGAMR